MWREMERIGWGYGAAAYGCRRAKVIDRTLARLGGDRQYEYESYWHGSYDDPQDYNCKSGSEWCKITLRKILEELYDSAIRCDQLASFLTDSLENHLSWWREGNEGDCCGVGPLLTPTEARDERSERRRKGLEHTAAAFAAQCGHRVGTREYARAARRAIADARYDREQWNDGETRMEQWAACRFAGVGADVYYDDLNFENSRFDAELDRLGDVLQWLEDTCPLLMRQCEHELDTEEDE